MAVLFSAALLICILVHISMASADSKIAIVGMACRFPGGAHNPEVFWELLLRGACTMEDVFALPCPLYDSSLNDVF